MSAILLVCLTFPLGQSAALFVPLTSLSVFSFLGGFPSRSGRLCLNVCLFVCPILIFGAVTPRGQDDKVGMSSKHTGGEARSNHW